MTTKSPTEAIGAAIKEIRREGLKIAVIYAIVDAALVFMLSNVALTLLSPRLYRRIGVEFTVPTGPLSRLPFLESTASVPTIALISTGLALLTFILEVVIRRRRPIIEQFESANPTLREALRTARDAHQDGVETEMAQRLYADVLERLRASSSTRLVNTARIAVTFLIVLVAAVGTVYLSVADVGIGANNRNGDLDSDGEPAAEYTGLQSPDAILGDRSDVSAGSKNLSAAVSSVGGRTGDGDAQARSYNQQGFDGDRAVDPSQAGYSEADTIEDATLIREYNLRIRAED